MNVQTFQKKLEDMKTLAKKNHNCLSMELTEQYFAEDGLDSTQLQKVFEYLKAQGIALLDKDGNREEAFSEDWEETTEEAAPLLPEEEKYLEEYRESLKDIRPVDEEERIALFHALETGSETAKKRLTELYLEEVIAICLQKKPEGLFLGDMIQEGNLALVMALEDWKETDQPHEKLCAEIHAGLKQMIALSVGQKRQDNYLVEKVEKLESTVRKLTEEVGDKFSIEELSILLDMEEEEIRDVLRLTGEE